MQLKCSFCNTMFNIGREESLLVAEKFHNNEISHYDAHCPKCRRAYKLTREQFARSNPALRRQVESKE